MSIKTGDINLYPEYNQGKCTWVLELYGLKNELGVKELVEVKYFDNVTAARKYILDHY